MLDINSWKSSQFTRVIDFWPRAWCRFLFLSTPFASSSCSSCRSMVSIRQSHRWFVHWWIRIRWLSKNLLVIIYMNAMMMEMEQTKSMRLKHPFRVHINTGIFHFIRLHIKCRLSSSGNIDLDICVRMKRILPN